MKQLYSVLPALALVLASCGGPTPQVDPLTLSFTTTGSADWGPTTALPLTDIFRNGDPAQRVGTLNPDKSVRITITPEQVRIANPLPTSNFKNNFDACTITGLTGTEGANYYRLTSVDFMDGTTESYLIPSTYIKNADGTINWVENEFWYMNQAANLTGTAACTEGTITFDLQLKAGWNHVQNTYTYNPTTETYTNDRYMVVDYSNTYSGGWLAYDY